MLFEDNCPHHKSKIMEEITTIGQTNFRNQKKKFGIKPDDRRRHMYVVGKTGMGKTVLLENMAIQDIKDGRGLAVIDPHGEFAERVLEFVPTNRVNDVVYFNPADLDYPIGFNAIEKVTPEHRHLVASGLIGVFQKIWADSWGPRLEYVLRNTILALLEYPGSTLLGIMRMLVDKAYRKKVIAKIKDPVVKAFWMEEFAKYPDRFLVEAVAPIQNKVGQFLSSSLIRNIVGQTKSKIDLREVMDKQKILVVNLSKGRIGEDNSALLGAMVVTKLQLAAMSRVDIPEKDRKDFYLYVDEFQNFATESFANILSEARKYRLDLIIAHQYITQMLEPVRDAVFGNVGTIITFRVGAADAEFMEKEFEPEFDMNDLVNLPKYNIYLKLMIDGVASRAFSATTLPPFPDSEKTNNKEKIIKVSRERHATDRKTVEEKITKWSGVIEDIEERTGGKSASGEKKSGYREYDKDKKMYEAVCAECQKRIEVPFVPDPKRETYCKQCLELIRKGEIDRKKGKKENQNPSNSSPASREKTAANPSSQKPISLDEAVKKEPASFKKKRKEVDKEELKRLIEDALENQEKENKSSNPGSAKNKKEKNPSNPSGNKKGVLKEGETVKF